ncbi:MAG: 6-phosphogluconolactonase [Candidatus Eremiobacterota bacterium]
MKRDLVTLPDAEAVSDRALEILRERLTGHSGPFRVALSGGTTPKRLYQKMAGADLPWGRLHLFWGDERCVAPDHPDSNYRMVREALLDHVSVPEGQVHRWLAERSPEEAARLYNEVLTREFGLEWPEFDLIWLGMGDDGHTASLFPDSPALAREDEAAVANYVEKLQSHRLTLTFPALNRGREVVFLVTGASKAAVLPHVLGEGGYPASRVFGTRSTLFLMDPAAAAEL